MEEGSNSVKADATKLTDLSQIDTIRKKKFLTKRNLKYCWFWDMRNIRRER